MSEMKMCASLRVEAEALVPKAATLSAELPAVPRKGAEMTEIPSTFKTAPFSMTRATGFEELKDETTVRFEMETGEVTDRTEKTDEVTWLDEIDMFETTTYRQWR